MIDYVAPASSWAADAHSAGQEMTCFTEPQVLSLDSPIVTGIIETETRI